MALWKHSVEEDTSWEARLEIRDFPAKIRRAPRTLEEGSSVIRRKTLAMEMIGERIRTKEGRLPRREEKERREIRTREKEAKTSRHGSIETA